MIQKFSLRNSIIFIALLSFLYCSCYQPKRPSAQVSKAENASPQTVLAGDGLIRNPSSIHYSKHAKCRMECRHIDENEVKQILANGTINYRKSELNNATCRNRYAVEGHTSDGQQLRIIFAPCNEDETVVTVIDLGREWHCDCG